MTKINDFAVTILDCTIRDGGYLNNWHFDKNLVRELYRSVSKSGIDIIEIGYRGSDKYFDRDKYGQWRFSDENLLSEVAAGINGAKIALMADFGKIEADDFIWAEDSVVDIVRVAAHLNDTLNAIELLEKIKRKGYQVSLNAMGYSNYSAKEKKELVSILKKSDIDFIYVVDSYGALFPDQIKDIIGPLLQIPHKKIGFHAHNSLQMAFANTLEAIHCGVQLVDCTFYGMGRGAGNLPTEIILLYMELLGKSKYNVIPVLSCIDNYFLPIRKKYEWGYQLPFMLSGMYKCHPDYAKKLIEYREYPIEDICRAMEFISNKNPTGYSHDILEKIIEGGLIGRLKTDKREEAGYSNEDGAVSVPYAGRYEGRDFLILANGPTLKDCKIDIDKFIKKVDPVIMGANNLSSLYTPHYHAFNNEKRFIRYIDTVSDKSKLLLSQYFSDDLIKEHTSIPYEKLYFKNVLSAYFDIKDGIVQTNCRTISVLLIGIAIVMGANRIFVVGMDGYLDNVTADRLLYYNEEDERSDRELIIERHKWCQRFLEEINDFLLKKRHEGIHILTTTTYKTFYKSIDNYIGEKKSGV